MASTKHFNFSLWSPGQIQISQPYNETLTAIDTLLYETQVAVAGLGEGTLSGLRVSLAGDKISVSAGVAIKGGRFYVADTPQLLSASGAGWVVVRWTDATPTLTFVNEFQLASDVVLAYVNPAQQVVIDVRWWSPKFALRERWHHPAPFSEWTLQPAGVATLTARKLEVSLNNQSFTMTHPLHPFTDNWTPLKSAWEVVFWLPTLLVTPQTLTLQCGISTSTTSPLPPNHFFIGVEWTGSSWVVRYREGDTIPFSSVLPDVTIVRLRFIGKDMFLIEGRSLNDREWQLITPLRVSPPNADLTGFGIVSASGSGQFRIMPPYWLFVL